ncbi:imidazolonepropionase [Gallaecimonas kandeliae]|uniref:imidazolonepropionase n=1 Tax=Gallaecimonas kandeliae TaxID=3029055 RepID=UPI0026497CDD|nr:imidazolonepropionase [Gallaecimonas kandeliae]WKE65368.1 imidazolonepropionase [Gallaecimonas kandeliae]
MSADWDQLVVNVNLATMGPAGNVLDGALAVKDGKIAWLGKKDELPALDPLLPVVDGRGGWLLPGFIDCHTHIVYGGSRAREFALRLEGASYEEIAKAGGGIMSTVRATREEDEESLYHSARARLRALLDEGVTTVEIKSGYGLELEAERKCLRVARLLGEQMPQRIRTTFLGAHAVPAEYKGDPDAYIDLVCDQMLPAIAAEGLADAVDAFCEGVGFSLEQTRKVFEAARQAGLPVKLHAEQLSNLGGSALAASFKALSVDHLEYLDEAGIKAIKDSGTVAVLLPGAFYFLRETKLPPMALLRKHGVPMAIATDINPGTSPLSSLLLMLNMGCTLFRLTTEEALKGATIHAAQALGMQEQIGSLEVGKQADMALWAVSEPAELCYQFGVRPLSQLWVGGKEVSGIRR